MPEQLDSIWKHCVAYPGAANRQAFIDYMKACQLDTTFYFAAINDKSLPETLRALHTRGAVADFIATHQGMDPARLQAEFMQFVAQLQIREPLPRPGPWALTGISRLAVEMSKLNATDIQGFVLRGYNLPVARYLFLHLEDATRARKMIGRLLGRGNHRPALGRRQAGRAP